MSEEENKKTPEVEVPEISIPKAEEAAPGDIVASKPEAKERQSAVIGQVDRPAAGPQQGRGRGPGGRGPGGRGPGGRGPGGRGRGPGGRGPGGQRGRRQQQAPVEEEGDSLFEKVVHINRCAKVVAGGRRFSFSALVVVGDQAGNVGVGYGKAKEVPECIRKGSEQARKNMKPIAVRNNTIPHEVLGNHDGGRILLRPAVPGTGVIAGGGVRAVLEAAGIKDVLTKSLRSNNPGAMVFATLDALNQLRTAEQIKALRKA
jgi:small subunit ribosomal protein S5